MKVHFDAPMIEAELSDRVHTLPISEDGNTNFAVGTSLVGVKPVVDVITADFLYRTLDSICNTAAKINFVNPNEPPKTIVIRSEFLIGGPTTGQRPEALFVHIPGLRVVIPSTPRDAYGLMLTALSTPGVTIFFEDRMILDSNTKREHKLLGVPIPFGLAKINRYWENSSVTVVTYGLTHQIVESILDNYSIPQIELLDLRTLYPIDWDTLSRSIERTQKLLVIEPDVVYGGIGAEIAATIAEQYPGVTIKRLGAPRTTIPASSNLHSLMLPSEEEILSAIRNV